MKKLSKEEVLRIVREMHSKLDDIYGDRLKGVYLYGSYARGDARDDSDIDVAVVLAGTVRRGEELNRTKVFIPDLGVKENCFITPLFLSETQFNERNLDVVQFIAEEGIPV
ncbi:MAG: nucleotidyltransferase domain-containing protein [Nitrospinae bacterium]|nr:nucleotidyltransferase domain-containing protein [Nitrospinota bacterium]